ncbi:hypothetical protein P1X15_09905 [Runella sp. MFBS21]|uniref:hypothetical protein n=1 Tax=Runella sp. MFBS21 TaxID=3034018 RepID=UPI0023F97C21|nr:hypothetical protein [Runella sp. MFBS21]MDF7817911.1 hypothetical protein [Runella sp. MFBS21]
MLDQLQLGKELGRKHFAQINAMSSRWKNRFIPAYIRTHLYVPYYLVEVDGEQVLYVIQYPLHGGRVSFLPLVRGAIPEGPS